LVPVNEDETPHTAAEMRSLADQAEAEAAEAEALAAAARARARAIQLRREAELVEAKKQPATEEAVSADDEAEPADSVQTEVQETRKIEPEDTDSADEPEDVETEESPDDADAEPDAEVSSDDDAAEQAVARPGRRWLSRLIRPKLSAVAAVLAVVVVLVALGASVEMIVQHQNATRQRHQVAEFTAAARQGVVTLTSLDFEHAKEGVQHILEVSTGSFKDDFLKMADDFTKVVEQSKVVSQGTVQAAAVDLDTMTDNSAVVLVASTSEVTNAAGAKQDPRKYRLIVTVTRDGDQLKMSKVEFVP
jgi:Mce-associated membrane protein